MREDETTNTDFLTMLYQTHSKRMWGYAYHLTGDKSLADDMVQTVFANIIRHQETLRGLTVLQLKAYLNTSIRNAVYNHQKKLAPLVIPLEPECADRASIEDWIQTLLDVEAIQLAMEELAEREQDIITLYYYVDLSYAEIGAVMQLTENHVGVILHRAIQKLKRILLPGGDADG